MLRGANRGRTTSTSTTTTTTWPTRRAPVQGSVVAALGLPNPSRHGITQMGRRHVACHRGDGAVQTLGDSPVRKPAFHLRVQRFYAGGVPLVIERIIGLAVLGKRPAWLL